MNNTDGEGWRSIPSTGEKRDVRGCRRATTGKSIRQTETRLTWLINPEIIGPITGPRNGAME